MQKGKKFFNIIIIITIIALISVAGYFAYYYISNYIALKQAEKAVDEFENEVIVEAQSVKVININILNGSDNNSSFKVSYTSDKPLVDVYTLDNLKDNILSNSMQSYEVILENYEDSASTIHFNLTIGEYDSLIEVDDIPLRIGE